jgi:hypothetical protein
VTQHDLEATRWEFEKQLAATEAQSKLLKTKFAQEPARDF